MTLTRSEIRRQNLLFLLEIYKTIANLNMVLGRKKNDSTLSQIKNRAKINGTETPRAMGTSVARSIEEKLNLPYGWMDKIHEDIQPETFSPKVEPLSKVRSLISIGLFELVSNETGHLYPKIKGEIQMPNFFIESLVQDQEPTLEAYISTDGAMFSSIPSQSIILVNRNIKKYVGDGLYLIEINGSFKFRKITQLINNTFVIKSDLTSENVDSLDQLKIHGKATNYWSNQRI